MQGSSSLLTVTKWREFIARAEASEPSSVSLSTNHMARRPRWPVEPVCSDVRPRFGDCSLRNSRYLFGVSDTCRGLNIRRFMSIIVVIKIQSLAFNAVLSITYRGFAVHLKLQLLGAQSYLDWVTAKIPCIAHGMHAANDSCTMSRQVMHCAPCLNSTCEPACRCSVVRSLLLTG